MVAPGWRCIGDWGFSGDGITTLDPESSSSRNFEFSLIPLVSLNAKPYRVSGLTSLQPTCCIGS